MLNRAQRIKLASRPDTVPVSIPSPSGGWNTRDSFDGMDPLDATQLDNWFPDAGGGLNVRNGFTQFVTGIGSAPVETLVAHAGGSGATPIVNRFLAACGGNIYRIDGVAASRVGYGYHNARWQTTGFLGRTLFVNGADKMQSYDGTALSPAAFTGVDTATLIGTWQYQQRLFFWQANSTGFWYALINSISGALAFYDLSPFTPRGGSLVAMTTISYDGGNGVIDYAVFLMSSGDAMVFQGNDPALSSNWSLVGSYRIAAPVSPRAVCDYGGDSFITTFDDHVAFQAMFAALRTGQMPPRSKVSKAVQIAVADNRHAFGWQALFYPRGRSLIFNIPNIDGTFDQHVCNTGVPGQPWCRYKGMNASCWGLYDTMLYFGGAHGTVYQADVGNNDNGQPIEAVGYQAWNKFKKGARKRVAAARPVLQSNSGISYLFKLGFDYASLNIPIPVVTPGLGSPWDTSPWDTSPWSPETAVDPRWHGAGGSGTAVGWGITMASISAVSWFRTDLRIEGGNAL